VSAHRRRSMRRAPSGSRANEAWGQAGVREGSRMGQPGRGSRAGSRPRREPAGQRARWPASRLARSTSVAPRSAESSVGGTYFFSPLQAHWLRFPNWGVSAPTIPWRAVQVSEDSIRLFHRSCQTLDAKWKPEASCTLWSQACHARCGG
jgi:hypothetical protein